MFPSRFFMALLATAVLCGSCSASSSDKGASAEEEPKTASLQSADAAEILIFAPVVESLAPPCGTETFPTDLGECLVLGTERLDSSIVESASVVVAEGSGNTIQLVLTEEGIVRFNELTSACFNQDASCPTARLAIVSGVLDGQLLTAPTVQAARFERDQLSISGDFDRAEAELVAERLNG